ncbi:hypothetical protein PPTG_11024 [Phytophthora nicotianae INRA-310]|uniref:Uncharacterized protein n=1 Tax=Phytophthora nicotianae (strain INRA-310) TaxID=761204 RepID=W2Q6Z0_PHYN3|nr:hypothetical protein PPTG_11024 [Phytophthora nicotianae INRA-310]ETN08958.1 hypothetical protein PPTG_11024 [Phytophthora nicotianae INRA-310]
MPSFKTASYDAYFDRLLFFWKHVRFLLALSAKQAFLQWRFTQDRAKMKALDTLAQRLVPNASKQVCISYGDWSRRGGIKGHPTGPVIGCHKRLKQARLFHKLKTKDDEEDIRTKERPSPKERKEVAEDIVRLFEVFVAADVFPVDSGNETSRARHTFPAKHIHIAGEVRSGFVDESAGALTNLTP